ncbi:MAG: hypothetical protein ACJAZS_000625 [Alteromonas naphthalenivorans]
MLRNLYFCLFVIFQSSVAADTNDAIGHYYSPVYEGYYLHYERLLLANTVTVHLEKPGRRIVTFWGYKDEQSAFYITKIDPWVSLYKRDFDAIGALLVDAKDASIKELRIHSCVQKDLYERGILSFDDIKLG